MRRLGLFLMCILTLWLFGAVTAFAQTAAPAPKPQEAKPAGFPVTLDDRELFRVTEPIAGYRPELRAVAISERIKIAAEDRTIPLSSLVSNDSRIPLTIIMAEDKILLTLTDQDAAAEGVTREQLTERYLQQLRAGIEQYRRDRSPKQYLMGFLYLAIATILLVAVLVLINRIYRRTDAVLEARVHTKKVSIHIQSFEIVRAERIRAVMTWLMKATRIVIVILLLYTYVNVGLSFFPSTRPFASQLLGYVLVPIETIAGGFWKHVPNLIFIGVLTVITVYILRLMRLFFGEIGNGHLTFKGFYPEWAEPTFKICRLLVVAFMAVIAFPYIPGSDSPAFKGVSIFVGVLFSLGSSSAIANIIAGFSLTYRRAFKVGDRIRIGDVTGDVTAVRLQATHLSTIKNEVVTIPNATIVSSNVINYSSLAGEQGLILHTGVTIGYDAPWRQVHAMLLLAAERTEGLLREPAPFVLQASLDDFYVSYQLNAYTNRAHEMERIYSDLHENIQDAFNEHGVQIMSPHYLGDPDGPKVVAKEAWYAPPAKPPEGAGGGS